MTYFLGKDVQVWILSENDANGVQVSSYEAALNTSLSVTNFANKLGTDAIGATYLLADVTGIDLTLGIVDENISYYGKYNLRINSICPGGIYNNHQKDLAIKMIEDLNIICNKFNI